MKHTFQITESFLSKYCRLFSDTFAVINFQGKVIFLSEQLEKIIAKKAKKRVTTLNPDLSILKWQSIVQNLDEYTEFESLLMLKGDEVQKRCVRIERISEHENNFLYLIRSKSKKNANSGSNVQFGGSKQVPSLDDLSPNEIVYFDLNGVISYKNIQASNFTIAKEIKTLFLEADLGELTESLHHFDSNSEHIMRMVMRTTEGLKDGYSRITIYPGVSEKYRYRLNFIRLEKMHLIDPPVEEFFDGLTQRSFPKKYVKSISISSNQAELSDTEISTSSPKQKKVLQKIAQVAGLEIPVLIHGDTGTGKEYTAKSIHRLSSRANEKFIKLSCSTIPDEILEDELFGTGSFVDENLHSKNCGKIEQARGGTLFLDEITAIPKSLQIRLLSILEEGYIVQKGKSEKIPIDVRIIASTSQDILPLINKGKFSKDLYYRINVYPLHCLPLRERKEDIPAFVEYFIKKSNNKIGRQVSFVKESTMARLLTYDYPGNIRELGNLIERAIIQSTNETLPEPFVHRRGVESNLHDILSLDSTIKNNIIAALKLSNGKITGQNSASEFLQINGKTLASKIKKYNIDPKIYSIQGVEK